MIQGKGCMCQASPQRKILAYLTVFILTIARNIYCETVAPNLDDETKIPNPVSLIFVGKILKIYLINPKNLYS